MTAGPTRAQFWALVEQSLRDAAVLPAPRRGLLRRRVVLRPGERHVQALVALLIDLPDGALVGFQEHLDTLRAGLHRPRARDAGRRALGTADDDAFTDLSTWLVSQGRAAYERVLGDPDALADVAPADLLERIGDAETWGYVALEVWDSRHDDDMPRPGVEPGRAPDDQDDPDDPDDPDPGQAPPAG